MNPAVENQISKRDFTHLSIDEVRTIILEQDAKIQQTALTIQELTEQLNWFQEQFKLLQHKRFLPSTEKQSLMQENFFDEGVAEEAEDDDEIEHEEISYIRKKPQRKDKHIDTSGLPRERHIIDLPDDEKNCSCGSCLVKIGEEIKEEIIFKSASVKVIEHVRIKYACRPCETIKAPKPIELPILKSKASASLLTEVIINKYQYHLPLYRQSKMLATHGIQVPDNTLGGWVMKSAEQLEPLYNAFWNQFPSLTALQADETPVKLLKPEKKAYMWLYHSYLPGKRFVLFDFNLGRNSSAVNERLKHFKGLLQTDGYSGYNAQRARDDIISIGCWDHARRKFADVVKACGKNKTGKAGRMLKLIAKLYELETEIKHLPADQRLQIRQEKAAPRLETIEEYLYKINAPPKSLLGVAVFYCKNQWKDLVQYIEHGEGELSNCWIENQVRPFAVGKRNWLFLGNEESAKRGALLYSLIQTCGLNEIDSRQYLEYVLGQVHRMRRGEVDPATLLPHTIDKALITN